MNNKNKLWIIIGASLAAIGLLIFAVAMIALDFDFTKLSTAKSETNTYEIGEDFERIGIDADIADIEFVPSENNKCKVVCFEKEKVKYSATVKGGTLAIGTVDTRKWYDHIGFFFGRSKITVYLPKDEYASLLIKGSIGNIEIPKDFVFETIDVTASTGSVECYASASELIKIKLTTGNILVENISAGSLDLSTTTGGIRVSDLNCKGDISVNVSTGRTELTDITCKGLVSRGSTGNIVLKKVIASENYSIERSTGHVKFEGSDAAEIYVETSTGDVTGTLLSEKVFITETDTGHINVPKSITGGRCEIETSTGDIIIDIE